MAVTKALDSISVALKRQLENGKYVDEVERQGEPSLDTRLFSSAVRVLESKIEFETSQVQSYTILANLKGKYKLLSPPKKVPCDKVTHNSSTISSSLQSDTRYGTGPEESPKRSNVKPSQLDAFKPQVPQVTLFPEDGIKLGWQGNELVGAGMINLGNTCYLNSTLQALLHVPSFCNWLKSETQHNGIGKCDQAFISGDMCLICAMVSTLRISQSHTGSVMKPVLIYGRLKSICKHLSHGHQEDAHEFLRFLIEGMERCYLLRYKGKKLDNLTKETTPLHRIFGGFLRNEVVCHSCGKTSTTFQLFQDLFLDIRHSNSLMESMEAFFSRERLEGDDRNDSYRCEECKRKGNCSKRVYVQTPPKVLCFQLKRFTAMGKKIMKHISYPLKLDLSPFVYMKTVNKNGDIISPLPKVRRPIPYKLVSLVSHYGSAVTCGHYTAVGKSAKGSYFTFDDSLVRPASFNSALGACAYILMYEMEPGWNVGLGQNIGDRVNNGSLRPAKSLPELSHSCDLQTSLPSSAIHSEVKTNTLLGVKPPQHSRIIQENAALTACQQVKSKAARPATSNMETETLTPVVPKLEAFSLSSSSLSVQGKIPLNGCLKKNFSIPTPKPSPCAVSQKTQSGNNISNSPPNQSQDTTNVIRRPLLLELQPEVKVKKDPIGQVKGNHCGPSKDLLLKSSNSSLNTLCDNVKHKSNQKEVKHTSSKELINDQRERTSVKRKYSTSSLEDDKQLPVPLKRQLTLPDLLNRRNTVSNCGDVAISSKKIKTLKDWLEFGGTSKGGSMLNKGLHQTKVLSQVQTVVSTVSGWRVTNQNADSSNPVSDTKCSNAVLKRKREVVDILSENKKKKLDQVTNAQLWRNLFKNKILNSKLNKMEGGQGSKKSKQKEKGDVNCALKQPDSDGSKILFQKL